MIIDDFVLENWLNPACDSEKNKIYLGGSCVEPLTVEELFNITGENLEDFLENIRKMNLGYPEFEGTKRTKNALSTLYNTVKADDIILCHGGTGANSMVVFTLINPSDNIISIVPNYQQFISMPKAIGTEVRNVQLRPEKGYKLDINELDEKVDKHTKAIMFTNPNNPTGSLLNENEMNDVIDIAKKNDSWIVCDEMYRGLNPEYMPSFADMYEKTIVTASSSKVYSMAGTRCGWIVCKNLEMRKRLYNFRSYESICGGVFDEWIFAIAMEHAEKILMRARKIVEKNRSVIDNWISNNKYLHQYAEGHGTTYLIHYDLDIPAIDFCEGLLDKKGVLVCHGDCFSMPNSFRISLAHGKNLVQGLMLIDEYIQELVSDGIKTKKFK